MWHHGQQEVPLIEQAKFVRDLQELEVFTVRAAAKSNFTG